jgi:enoyl-CoA hydratase/carnithine racemase
MASEVRYEVERGVAWITIDRPEARNALSAAVRSGVLDATERFNADDDARVMVLTGAGEQAFCAGGDLKEMAATELRVPPPDFVPQFGRTIAVSKPTIAAVNGVAYAGGFLLALMCDLCVAADHARFAITEAKVGRGAPWAARLARIVPPRVAMELLVTGDPIDAHRAYALGFVNAVVAAADLHGAAQELGERIAANAPLSVAAAKSMVREAWDADPDAFARAEALWEPVYLSEDAQEGPRAFRERRPPDWQGR